MKAGLIYMLTQLEQMVELPLQPIFFLKLVVIILFGFIILITFVYGTLPSYIFRFNYKDKTTNDIRKEPTKLIGGLGVFIVALIANNPYVYALSLFIGGLLIASEKFMIHLAAIFNSNKKRSAEISRLWVNELRPDEIEQKQESEAQEVISDKKESDANPDKPRTSAGPRKDFQKQFRETLAKIRSVEAIALKEITSQLVTNSTVIKRYVRLTVNGRDARFDAVGQDLITHKVMFALEVKYYSYLTRDSVDHLRDRLSVLASTNDFPIIAIIVYEHIHNDLLAAIENKMPTEPLKDTHLGFIYYQVSGGDKLKPINTSRLSELLPSEFAPRTK